MDKIKFGTDGWRSRMDDSFNVENVKKVAQAIADYLKEEGKGEGTVPARLDRGQSPQIFIGYDTRAKSDIFANACAQVLSANNIAVLLPKRAIPTPITAYTIKAKHLAGAIMITASHNPPQYNGIKFIPFYAGPATEDVTRTIEKNLRKNVIPSEPFDKLRVNSATEESQVISSNDNRTRDPSATPQDDNVNSVIASPEGAWQSYGKVKFIDPIPEYKTHLKKLIDTDLLKKANLNVLVNPMHGAAFGVFAYIAEEFGCNVKEIDGEPDPNFGGLTPEPIPANMASTVRELKNGPYDIALALDGDGDRFGVLDKNSYFIQANHVLALIADYLVTVRKLRGGLVRSVATTHFLDFIAENHDLEISETPVGFKYIGQIMRERPVVLGGEESAGLSILNHIPEKDGFLANLLLAEITAYYQKPLSGILEDLFTKYGRHFLSKRLDLELPQEKKESLIKHLKESPPGEIAGLKVAQTVDIDGAKFILEDESWLLARPSGTEPIIRIYLEADQERTLKKLEAYAIELANGR